MSDLDICPLCERPIPPGAGTKHHLVPKLRGGKRGPTVLLHAICHGKLHSLFSETELARHYNTIEALRGHPEVAKFVRWVARRPPGYRSSNRRARR